MVYAVLPAVRAFTILSASFVRGPFLYDFDGGVYRAGTAIVNGQSPYRADYVEHRAALNRSGRPGAAVLSVPVYPSRAACSDAAQSAALPVAGMLFTLLSIAALIVGLRLLGVRDWRCLAWRLPVGRSCTG